MRNQKKISLWHTQHRFGKVTDSPHPGQKEVMASKARFKVVVCGRRWGKDLSLETPILTTKGWRKLKQVRRGDFVYGPDGQPTKVVSLSEIYTGKPCYKITFSDGSTVVCSETHEWVVKSRVGDSGVVTTKHMAKNFKYKSPDGKLRNNYSIPNTEPLAFPEKNLPIHPYVFGYWLEKGKEDGAEVVVEPERKEGLESRFRWFGYFLEETKTPNVYRILDGRESIRKRLFDMGMLFKKSIPKEYFNSHFVQRSELLRGLMDARGVVKGNKVYFFSQGRRVRGQVYELICSLGMSAREMMYTIEFSPNMEVFGLRDILKDKRLGHSRTNRYITNIMRAPTEPTRCITVDNKSHQFLVGRGLIPTHNSMLGVVAVMSHALQYPDSLLWIVGPSYRQVKNIAWKMIMTRIRLFPKDWQSQCTIREKDLFIELPNGSIIELKGATDPSSLVGSGLDGVVLDEYAMDPFQEYPVWEEIVRPSLADKQGWAMFCSTPRGYNGFFDLFDRASNDDTGEWQAWKMPTSTNPYISKKELEQAKAEIGEDLFEQEFNASFMKRSGLVYKEFNRETHVIDNLEPEDISAKWRLEVGIDFGASHPTAGIFIMYSDTDDAAYIVDEYYETDKHTDYHVNTLRDMEAKWVKNLVNKKIKRIADSQARQEILNWAHKGYYITPTLKGAGSVEIGIDMIRSRLLNDYYTGRPKLFVCRRCVNTIREFENYAWLGQNDEAIEANPIMRLSNKRKDAPRKTFDDAMDAVRYSVTYHRVSGEVYVNKLTRKNYNPITGF